MFGIPHIRSYAPIRADRVNRGHLLKWYSDNPGLVISEPTRTPDGLVLLKGI